MSKDQEMHRQLTDWETRFLEWSEERDPNDEIEPIYKFYQALEDLQSWLVREII